jgi:DNA-directed RNA polymerase specialized sigma24 family protein
MGGCNLHSLETATIPSPVVADFYRFALLLTGDAKAAERALGRAMGEIEAELGSLRSAASRNAWLVVRLRQLCKELAAEAPIEEAPRLLRAEEAAVESGEFLEIEAFIFAQRFHRLVEPERSALAVFYLELLSLEDAAKLFSMPLEQWCATLGRARAALREIMHEAETQAPAAASV